MGSLIFVGIQSFNGLLIESERGFEEFIANEIAEDEKQKSQVFHQLEVDFISSDDFYTRGPPDIRNSRLEEICCNGKDVKNLTF